MFTIFIVKDEQNIRNELFILLTNAGYNVDFINDFTNIIQQIESKEVDLILLDIGLPNQSGLSICAQIRHKSNIPIVFVTSHNTSMDELNALS